MVLADASPRFGNVARVIEPLTPDRPLQDAWAPVVDESRCPVGLVTGASVFSFLSLQAAHDCPRAQPETDGEE